MQTAKKWGIGVVVAGALLGTILTVRYLASRPLTPEQVARLAVERLEAGDWTELYELTSEVDNQSTNMTQDRFVRLMGLFVPGKIRPLKLGSHGVDPGERAFAYPFPVEGIPGSYITVRKAPEGYRLVSGEILNSAARIYDQGPDRYKRMLAGMKQEGIEQLESFMGVITLATLERKIQDPSANILKVRTNPFANRP